MLVLKFLIMAVAAVVDKIFQSELRPSQQGQLRADLRQHFYRDQGEGDGSSSDAPIGSAT